MDKEKLLQFLQATNLITSEKAAAIADGFAPKTIDKNEFFLREGQVSKEYLFLDNGYMRAFAVDTEGHEVTTGFYTGNGVVFEVSSFFNQTPSQEAIQALTACEGWFITYRQLNDLFHSLPEFRLFGRDVLVKGFTALKTRMLSMITETAEERYATLLKTKPEIFQQAPLKTLPLIWV